MATTATIRLPRWNRVIAAHFAPCEIKTFWVRLGMAGSNSLCSSGDTVVTETNLLEWTEEVGR
jgi:alpha-mannosidase